MPTMVYRKAKRKLLLAQFFLFFCFGVSGEDRWASGSVNVRTGPGITYDVMGQLQKNEKVEVFNEVKGWAQILFENIEGYVSMELLLEERIKTPEEEEAARIEAEREKAKQEKELLISRILRGLIIAAGIAGTIFIARLPK